VALRALRPQNPASPANVEPFLRTFMGLHLRHSEVLPVLNFNSMNNHIHRAILLSLCPRHREHRLPWLKPTPLFAVDLALFADFAETMAQAIY